MAEREREAATRPPRLLDQVRAAIRVRHYSRRTERAYTGWIRRYVLFHRKRHPSEMGATEIRAYLNHLATVGKVSASTQNQALCAIVFLYRHVLHAEVEWMEGLVRAKRPHHLPVVLTAGEAAAIIRQTKGTPFLMISLLFGSGLRLLECCRLRVKDLDFERREITVRDGKGRKDRVTMLPGSLAEPLWRHLEKVRRLHKRDLEQGKGSVELPLARHGTDETPSPARVGRAAGDAGGVAALGNPQTGNVSYDAPLLRLEPPRGRL